MPITTIPTPCVGQVFLSTNDAKRAIVEYCHQYRGNLRMPKHGSGRIHLVCKHADWPSDAFVSWESKDSNYIMRRDEPMHTCMGREKLKGGTLNSVSFVEAIVSSITSIHSIFLTSSGFYRSVKGLHSPINPRLVKSKRTRSGWATVPHHITTRTKHFTK